MTSGRLKPSESSARPRTSRSSTATNSALKVADRPTNRRPLMPEAGLSIGWSWILQCLHFAQAQDAAQRVRPPVKGLLTDPPPLNSSSGVWPSGIFQVNYISYQNRTTMQQSPQEPLGSLRTGEKIERARPEANVGALGVKICDFDTVPDRSTLPPTPSLARLRRMGTVMLISSSLKVSNLSPPANPLPQ
jgi:hypothetical protein